MDKTLQNLKSSSFFATKKVQKSLKYKQILPKIENYSSKHKNYYHHFDLWRNLKKKKKSHALTISTAKKLKKKLISKFNY